MKKIGILLFVSVLFFSCQKSQDEEFEKYIEGLQNEWGIVFLEKNGNEFFPPIELLTEDHLKDSVYLLNEKLKKAFIFQDEFLQEKNVGLKKIIQQYANQKINFDDEVLSDTLNFFSIINFLEREVRNKNSSPEEQFSQIIFSLEEIPNYFFHAKKIIKNPSKEKLENAIQQYSKDYFYLKNELSLLIRKPDILKKDQINFSQKNEKAQLAVKDFIAFLNSHLFELGE